MVEVDYIHQIMIVDGFSKPKELTGFFRENQISLMNFYRKAQYKLWGGKCIQDFLAKHFSKDVLETFNALEAYAYKADLARLCILYVYGGLYVDLGVRLMSPLDIPEGKEFCAYRDLYQESSWFMIQNGLIFSKKGRQELAYAIRWIVENKINKFYGENSLFPTGPVQLGRAVALIAAQTGPAGDPSQWIGECRPVTPSESNKNMIYSSPSGALSAFRAKIEAGDLAHMGLIGGNNHNVIWQSRKVYGESTGVWNSWDKQIRIKEAKRTKKGIKPKIFGKSLLTWGPYFSLTPGKYLWRVYFAGYTFFDHIVLEVCSHPNCLLLVSKKFSLAQLKEGCVELYFSTENKLENVELKFYKKNIFWGYIRSFEVDEV